MSLCEYEIEILRARAWGAAVGAALEVLRGSGYVTRSGQITDKGRQALAEYAKETETVVDSTLPAILEALDELESMLPKGSDERNRVREITRAVAGVKLDLGMWSLDKYDTSTFARIVDGRP